MTTYWGQTSTNLYGIPQKFNLNEAYLGHTNLNLFAQTMCNSNAYFTYFENTSLFGMENKEIMDVLIRGVNAKIAFTEACRLRSDIVYTLFSDPNTYSASNLWRLSNDKLHHAFPHGSDIFIHPIGGDINMTNNDNQTLATSIRIQYLQQIAYWTQLLDKGKPYYYMTFFKLRDAAYSMLQTCNQMLNILMSNGSDNGTNSVFSTAIVQTDILPLYTN